MFLPFYRIVKFYVTFGVITLILKKNIYIKYIYNIDSCKKISFISTMACFSDKTLKKASCVS